VCDSILLTPKGSNPWAASSVLYNVHSLGRSECRIISKRGEVRCSRAGCPSSKRIRRRTRTVSVTHSLMDEIVNRHLLIVYWDQVSPSHFDFVTFVSRTSFACSSKAYTPAIHVLHRLESGYTWESRNLELVSPSLLFLHCFGMSRILPE
jgi:hypothetical protein